MTPLPSTIYVATGNAHKVTELSLLLARHAPDVVLRPFTDLGIDVMAEETGTTFEENAYIKARAIADATGVTVLADDSGIEVDALDGRPGVYSARYSGPDATDATNRRHLLQALHGVAEERRGARFRCVLCLVDASRTTLAEGWCRGRISTEERGEGGFGYDSLFIPDGYDTTYADLPASVKQTTSHRARAVERLATLLARQAAPVEHLPLRTSLLDACLGAALGDTAMVERSAAMLTTADEATAMYEAILQTYLFAGFPAGLEGLAALRASVPVPGWLPPAHEEMTADVIERRGTMLCRQVYGDVHDRMMERLHDVSPDLQRWMTIEGYGKTLSRNGLSALEREVCIVAVLAATNRTVQLRSHVRGAYRLGASRADLGDVLDAVVDRCGRAALHPLEDLADTYAGDRP